jgi:hypothetical protein
MSHGRARIPSKACLLALIASQAAFAQVAGAPRVAVLTPVISIVSSPSGVPVRTFGQGDSVLDLGAVSYFRGASIAGESTSKQPGAMVVSTRFTFRVDCSPASLVDVTMTRLDADPSHGIAVDGITVSTAAQVFAQSLLCGTSGEHRLDLEVPISTPAGTMASTVAFVATLRK